MAKKKEQALTLIQCSFGAKLKMKLFAKKKGAFLNREVDKAIAEYIDKHRNEIY
jgi:hypothetical protein